MELASRLRWVIIIIVFLIVLILLGWGMYSIARSIFVANSDSSTTEMVSEEDIFSVESAGEVNFTVDGPVVAADEHRSVKITVRPSTVTITVFKNYGTEAIDTKGYLNSNAAYREFLSALAQENVLLREKGTDEDDDYAEDGVCSTGRTYILELDNDIRRWSTSCRGDLGTAGFNMTAVRRLFEKQVPDYREITRGTGL
jgi:hypothetical protein